MSEEVIHAPRHPSRAPAASALEPRLICQHEPAPQPLAHGEIMSGGMIVDCSSLPRAGGSRYTHCVHCGEVLRAARDTRRRITIWAWRELMGFDPYGDEMPASDA